MGYPTQGSLGTCFGADRNVPVRTIEFDRGYPPEQSGLAPLRGLEAILRDRLAVDRVD
ncbi:MAG: hypothetical protein AAF726_15690 [Planctomycetota bacterium]